MTIATPTYKEAVHQLLKPRKWINTRDIQRVGGADGVRRLRELREEGYNIKARRSKDVPGTYEYRLTKNSSK